jgi:acyl-CoA dehydrogenase
MTDMINNSRLSNGVRAAGLMRRALNEALFVAGERAAFGRRLIELPLMQRQLAKMMVWTEQARTMMFQTAAALGAADRGDAPARQLVRILTPLIKFRACRDARKVAGDAMEVRGGCGYIEEWAEARVLRDAHLGSIWEGTSNVVALDVMRAIRREDALAALQPALAAMLPAGTLGAALGAALERGAQFAAATAQGRDEAHARQAASGLYYLTAASVLASEGERLAQGGDARRLLLAALVHEQRLRARDPLRAVRGDFEGDLAAALLAETPVSPGEARSFLDSFRL